ncbi:hypothetical protein NMY22_g13581 [Coprinellus aureogranulatus]|nr:hypothetical protein NMY22_g13581 [Coprinellus aureogranulatus]
MPRISYTTDMDQEKPEKRLTMTELDGSDGILPASSPGPKHFRNTISKSTHSAAAAPGPPAIPPPLPAKPVRFRFPQPWYRRRKTILMIAVCIVAIVIAGIVGGVVGSKKRRSPSAQDPSESAEVGEGGNASGTTITTQQGTVTSGDLSQTAGGSAVGGVITTMTVTVGTTTTETTSVPPAPTPIDSPVPLPPLPGTSPGTTPVDTPVPLPFPNPSPGLPPVDTPIPLPGPFPGGPGGGAGNGPLKRRRMMRRV